ncbi:MAG: silent information regulator protein Sir2 [Ignavibacteriales bacterium]|nr:silent information regulator protein Sir2 [Ignavibacteriales bacterium]
MRLNIVIFSGAGLSTESGIPTFRDSGGLWEQHRIEDVASPEGWERNKKLVLDFYGMRFLKQLECKPNPAHEAIGKLAAHHSVTNITQNIDTLLERSGSEKVWHLHGRIDMQKCEFHRSLGFTFDSGFDCDFKSRISKPIQLGDLCPKCGGQLRPDIVWFGEPVDMREDLLMDLIKNADIFIGVGTSAQVYPAAGLLPMFRRTKEKYFIDPNPNYELLDGFEVLNGSASEQMPKLVEKILG